MPLTKYLILLAIVIASAGLSVWLVTTVFAGLSVGAAFILPVLVLAALALRLRKRDQG